MDSFLAEKKKKIREHFNQLTARREQDLATLNSLKGQFALIEELEQLTTPTPEPEEA